ncbi:HAD-IIB family hydrolase [Qipengyuania sediminis]|uniref:HAD-IIB family hydrolase n=1 Tax=Qipengyuania sediminis TaxID=1532023 RepID=UPI00140499D0|nr:HAD-IIB family hydrolase [Qipengyuania sediminis]
MGGRREPIHILAIALGGCLKGPPVAYGITEDTGGHIGYVLGAMGALARDPRVGRADIATRLFDDPALGRAHVEPVEELSPKSRIIRIDSGNRAYLAKEELARDRAAFTEALIAHLECQPRLPDVIHAHFADAADVAREVKRRLGIPFIYTAHSLGIDKRAASGVRCQGLEGRIAEEDRAIAACDLVVASSRDECERQLLAYPSGRLGKIRRLRPGIETTAATPAEQTAARALIAPFLRDPDRPIVLAVARAVRKKNLVTLVEAFAENPALRERANLVILAGLRDGLKSGEAEQREVLLDLVDAIDRYGLHGVCAWPAHHTQGELAGLYDIARRSGGVFVNPAFVEPYGLTLIEAAAHGLPVVATREGGPRDIVAELEHGLLVDPRDPAGIAGAITRLVDDSAFWNRCSENARVNVAEMSWESYAAGFVSLVQGLVTPRPTAQPRCRPTRLLLSDIDNTLTGCREGAARLSRYLGRDQGQVLFGVATGRAFVDAQRLLAEWSLPQPAVIVSSVGTEIYWRYEADYLRDEAYSRRLAEGWDGVAVAQALDGIPGLEPQSDIEQRTFKRSYLTADAAAAEHARRVLAEAGLSVRIIASHARFLDIVPANGGKGAAMAHVARMLGLRPQQIVAAGDSGNDADMLADCPGAVVVANHDRDLAHLIGRPGIYAARRGNAAGVLEGLLWHRWQARVARQGKPRVAA